MVWLVAGLVLFLGVHSVRIVADGWRARLRARVGEGAWKGAFSLLSAAGLALVVVGFGAARSEPVVLWSPPPVLRHLASLLTLVAFVLLAAAYVPGNRIKAALHHPMVLGVKTWALAHLLANGTLAEALLFGSFLAWSVVLFAASRRRDRAAGTIYPAGRTGATVVAVGVGAAAWATFAIWAHAAWIGVRPFG